MNRDDLIDEQSSFENFYTSIWKMKENTSVFVIYQMTKKTTRVLVGDYSEKIKSGLHNGVQFYDMDPLLADPAASWAACKKIADNVRGCRATIILGIESRGYALAPVIAHHLGVGWKMGRKAGKTPGEVYKKKYMTEYCERELELGVNAFKEGDRVLIVDDVLATGGSASAMAELVEMTGAKVVACCFLIELDWLKPVLIKTDADIVGKMHIPYYSLMHVRDVSDVLNIVVASTSLVKKRAVMKAMDELYPNASVNIIMKAYDSGVPVQPANLDIGIKGCVNRLNACVKQHPDKICIAIENYCNACMDDANYIDAGLVMMYFPNGTRRQGVSEAVHFPAAYYEASKAASFNVTVGKLIYDAYNRDYTAFKSLYGQVISPDDWHILFSEHTREELLANTIKKLLSDSDGKVTDISALSNV